MLLVFPLLFFYSCETLDVFEQTKAFPQHSWSSKEKLSFQFSITDTTVGYNIFIVVRHTDAYRYNNLWLDLTTITPANVVTDQKIELKLGDNVKGWLGTAMDDIIEHRVLITPTHPIKLQKGTYTFNMQQIMRDDPIENVLNAGVRVEKAVQ